jgi:hypothetical protein
MFIARRVQAWVERYKQPARILSQLPPDVKKGVTHVANVMAFGAFTFYFIPAAFVLSSELHEPIAMAVVGSPSLVLVVLTWRNAKRVLINPYTKFEDSINKGRSFSAAFELGARVAARVYLRSAFLTWFGMWAVMHSVFWAPLLSTHYGRGEEGERTRQRGLELNMGDIQEQMDELNKQRKAFYDEIWDIEKEQKNLLEAGEENPNVEAQEERKVELREQLRSSRDETSKLQDDLNLANAMQTYYLGWHLTPLHWGAYMLAVPPLIGAYILSAPVNLCFCPFFQLLSLVPPIIGAYLLSVFFRSLFSSFINVDEPLSSFLPSSLNSPAPLFSRLPGFSLIAMSPFLLLAQGYATLWARLAMASIQRKGPINFWKTLQGLTKAE